MATGPESEAGSVETPMGEGRESGSGRVSVVDAVRLANGQLASIAARSNGISEAVFRARVKFLSPGVASSRAIPPRSVGRYDAADDVAFQALLKVMRLERRLARRSLRLAERSAGLARGGSGFGVPIPVRDVTGGNPAEPGFPGVLVETFRERLAVRPSGSGFLFQELSGRSWRTAFENRYHVRMVDWLSDRGYWSFAAALVPSHWNGCVELLASGELPVFFAVEGGKLRWLVEEDETGR